jgi:hypothetical protein
MHMRKCWVILIGVLVVAFTPVAVRAQVQFESKPLGNKSDVEDRFRPQLAEFGSLLNGNVKYTEKHKQLVELASRYLVHRVTWIHVQSDFKPTGNTAMEQVRKDFQNYMVERLEQGKDKNDDLKNALCKEVAARFDEVFELPLEKNRLAHVNAAMLLADFGKTKNLEARDYLVGLVKNPKSHNLIKLFAVKGLAEYFPAREFLPLLEKNKKPLADQFIRDVEQIDLLVKFIEQDWKLPEKANPGELEGIRYVRREAIKSLALAEVPAAEVSKEAAPSGIAVVTLMRVCTDELTPPPSLTEKLEAALGLCKVKKSPTSTYNPDIGVYLVAKVLHEFVSAYQKDWNEFRTSKERQPATTWRLHAKRIDASLDTLVNNTRVAVAKEDADAGKRAQELQLIANNALLGPMKTHGSLGGVEIDRLGQFVNRIKPKEAIVFRNLPPMPLKLN